MESSGGSTPACGSPRPPATYSARPTGRHQGGLGRVRGAKQRPGAGGGRGPPRPCMEQRRTGVDHRHCSGFQLPPRPRGRGRRAEVRRRLSAGGRLRCGGGDRGAEQPYRAARRRPAGHAGVHRPQGGPVRGTQARRARDAAQRGPQASDPGRRAGLCDHYGPPGPGGRGQRRPGERSSAGHPRRPRDRRWPS